MPWGDVIMGDIVVTTGGDNKAPGESFIVATVGDMNAGAGVVVGKCPLISKLLCVVSK